MGQVAELATDSDAKGPTRATITQVYPAVSAGKVSVDLSAPGISGNLIGRRLALRLALGQRQALVIPSRFVITRSGVDYARLAESDGSVDEVPIEAAPGPAAGEVEVLSGLADGDVLVGPGERR